MDVGDSVELGVTVMEAEEEAELDGLCVADVLCVVEGVGDAEFVAVAVAVSDEVGEFVGVSVLVVVEDAVVLAVPVLLAVSVELAVGEADSVLDGVLDGDLVVDAVLEGVGLAVSVVVGDGVAVRVVVLDLDIVGVGVGVRLVVNDSDGVLERDVDGVTETDGETELVFEMEGVGEAVHCVEVASSSYMPTLHVGQQPAGEQICTSASRQICLALKLGEKVFVNQSISTIKHESDHVSTNSHPTPPQSSVGIIVSQLLYTKRRPLPVASGSVMDGK